MDKTIYIYHEWIGGPVKVTDVKPTESVDVIVCHDKSEVALLIYELNRIDWEKQNEKD